MITASPEDVEVVRQMLARHKQGVADVAAALLRIMVFAYEKVPFYREHWEHLRGESAFDQVPPVERCHLSRQLVDLCADDIASRRVFRHRTSGSSGESVVALVDIHDWYLGLVSIASQLETLGFPVLSAAMGSWSFCQVTAYNFDSNAEFITPLPGMPVWRRVNVPCVPDLEPKLAAAMRLSALTRGIPFVLNGLPDVLLVVARLFMENRLPIPSPEIVITSGAHLSDVRRKQLEHYYRADVYSFYSAGEVGVIGFECRVREGLHLEVDRLLVELVGSSGGRADVVATTLENRAMPLVRYKVGDTACALHSPCRCGDPRPRIGSVVGASLKRYKLALDRAFQTDLSLEDSSSF
jgi:phenylacetate-coenzyme A ligase PaaK-like adenylate-forming protein